MIGWVARVQKDQILIIWYFDSPLFPLPWNSTLNLASTNEEEKSQEKKHDNYLEMAPTIVSEDQLPLRPFEPLDYRNRTSNIVDEPVDPISLRLQVSIWFWSPAV